jgi:hypothetical protein
MIALTVTLILDVENSSEAADAANEILREHQHCYAPSSCLIDYAVNLPVVRVAEIDTGIEGDAFA